MAEELNKELQHALALMEQRLAHNIGTALRESLGGAMQAFAEKNNAGMLAAQAMADEAPRKRFREQVAATCYITRLKAALKSDAHAFFCDETARYAVNDADALIDRLNKRDSA